MPRTGKQVRLNRKQSSFDHDARIVAQNKNSLGRVSTEQKQKYLQWNWVHGSNRKGSIELKEAVQKELGAKGLIFNPRKFKTDPSVVNNLKGAVRKTYRNTQTELKRQGKKSIRLYRGVKSDIQTQGVLESWTSDPEVAKRFGKDVMVEDVPISKIYNYSGSDQWTNGVWGEQKEYTVIGR